MRAKGNLGRAEHKIRPFDVKRRLWCGCVTPSEAIALLDDGAKPEDSALYQREYLQDRKDRGKCSPCWFYFYPSKEQQERWTLKQPMYY